jgi:tetratricopeptide (TPR) repeat protein
MLRSRSLASLVIPVALSLSVCAPAQQPQTETAASEIALRHSRPEWLSIASHLPDPKTATPADLELTGDILRARRLPEDALDYYQYALERGGDQVTLINRIGVTELELGQTTLARVCFKRVLTLKKNFSEGWNNLGAVESVSGFPREALSDYQRAVKLNKKSALFHANLGTAYFAVKDYESARKQYATAIKLDSSFFQRNDRVGSQIHVLSAEDRGRFAFEMARLAASGEQVENMLDWLAKASEAGFDIRAGMNDGKEFAPYRKDPRIAVILQNAKALRAQQVAVTGPVPVLASEATKP